MQINEYGQHVSCLSVEKHNTQTTILLCRVSSQKTFEYTHCASAVYTHTHVTKIRKCIHKCSVGYITTHTLFQYGRKRSGNIHMFLFSLRCSFSFRVTNTRFNRISVTERYKFDRTVSLCVMPNAIPFFAK